MTKRIKIPDSIERAEDRLVALDGIATATGWERAAIVYAFTYEGKGGPRTGRNTSQLTIRQFADLKLAGLSNRETVAFYRQNWEKAIETGDAQEIGPGDTVTMPTIDWPVQERNVGSRPTPANIGQQMAKDPKLLKAAIDAAADLDPEEVGKQAAKPAVAKAAMKDPKARKSIIKGAGEVRSEQAKQSSMRPRKKVDPKDIPEKDLTALEVQGLITEFHIAADEATIASRKAFDAHKKMQAYVTVEQTDDLAEVATSVMDAWQMVRESVLSGGVTDDDLQDLISQEQGGV